MRPQCPIYCRAVNTWADYDYALWTIVHSFVEHYWPHRRILLCALGHSAEICYELWARAHNFVHSSGPQCRITWTSFKSLPQPLKEYWGKKLYIYKMHYPRPIPPMPEILPSLETMILHCGQLRRMMFEFESRQIWNQIWNSFRLWIRGLGVLDLASQVRNVVLMNVYLDLGNPGGGRNFGMGGIRARGGKWEVSLRATWIRGGRSLSEQGGFQVSKRVQMGAKGE
jgi:hypothetical protein